jgi:hypothetical protein
LTEDAMKEAMRLYPAVLVVVREVRSYLLHRSPYGRVGAVNADPRGLLPSSLSAYVTVSIHDLDAFRLQPTPFNFTPTSLRSLRTDFSSRRISPPTSPRFQYPPSAPFNSV